MARVPSSLPVAVALNPRSGAPLYQQLYGELRSSILGGHFAAGTQLPSTRQLAEELAVSRNTVVNAYAQLLAEGYLDGQGGSGTYVARRLPDHILAAQAMEREKAKVLQPRRVSRDWSWKLGCNQRWCRRLKSKRCKRSGW